MIINTEPKDKATFGGTGAVSEFKIRNSAKAFGILSSGLYSNKIRAIIRELSCNAVDSHVAAGTKKNFDLHLPTQLAPYFSVRDYGIGLTHAEVCNVYTTYFESTKADSDDFIGALGLGSKSPFSYTDNFTVIAIKDGMKGIYSAFINDAGVPSVVQMGYDATDEPTGVEVKFAVVEHHDFYSFADEARHVFNYFPIKPNFTGATCAISDIEYFREAIVPGVNQRKSTGYDRRKNLAIMGNIAYPIDIPRGSLAQFSRLGSIDSQGLDLHFALGEIEFQASREGLQYTEKTISAIRAKYQEIANALEKIVADGAEAIDNIWDRHEYLVTIGREQLWSEVTAQYICKNDVPFFAPGIVNRPCPEHMMLSVKALSEKFNISLRVFDIDSSSYSSTRIARECVKDYNGNVQLYCNSNVYFIKNPLNEKIWTRAKEHFKTQYKDERRGYVISAVDPDKEVKFDEFAVYIHSPPTDRFIEVADLVKAVRKQSGDKISIVKINYDGYNSKCTWKADCLQLPDLDSAATYYYVPLVGFAGSTKAGKDLDIKQVYGLMKQSHIAKLQECSVYGVRAADIKTVQGLPNWIQLDVLVEEVLNDFKANDFLGVVLSSIESDKVDLYYNAEIMATIDPKSPLRVLHDKLPKTPAHGNRQIFELATLFDSDHNLKEMEAEAISEITSLRSRYPMFNLIRSRNFDDPACIEYIQLVDKQRGLN